MGSSEKGIEHMDHFDIDSALLDHSLQEERRLQDFLIFTVGDTRLAFENKGISEILKPQKITSIPFTRDFILGLINLRGEIISCIDCGCFFFSRELPRNERDRVILIGNEHISTGLMVSSIEGIESIDDESIDKAPEPGSDPIFEFVRWIINHDTGAIAVLDIEKILHSERLKYYETK